MPELPDLTIYREQLEIRIAGSRYRGVKIAHPFLLRSVEPKPEELVDSRVSAVGLLGKRIVISLENELHLVIHLMIAGRFKWMAEVAPVPKKLGLARFDFDSGSLLLTEAGTKRRASLTLVRSDAALSEIDPGGINVLESSFSAFANMITLENHTLKRTLTDPRLFAGIGNAYSDEILHRAKMSPFKQSRKCGEEEIRKLYDACRTTLVEWIDLLRKQSGDTFPKKVTAFHPAMSVHGKYDQPCPVCETPVQRIQYAENECNYCPACQTEGRLLADRALSRLLKDDWPKSVEELEELRRPS